MLSDEEKKALKNMRIFARVHQDMTIVTAEEMNIALNLIEKQSKEIEELKEVKWYYEISRVPKDKIKAKIEEVSNGTFDAKIVLQSLLEKE